MRKRHQAAARQTGPVFVDTGAWIALFSRHDSHHEEAEALFAAAVADQIPVLTTNLVVAEMQRLLLFRVGVEAAARAISVLERSEILSLHFPARAEHVAARSWLARLVAHKITYTDAVSFAVMESIQSRGVLGFDSDFDLAGMPRWSP